ncbi:hypothetical protein [Epilithonimonas xixisoli]|uniref:Uncharacterized protein n=1 Tax=Epilithonimonas xixisoli TaxID=1476462 RepID=A0A4R8I5U0_9FLAO|nr:hypothetical protein [Epilithonimonas xixisoli]TDX83116.1 hypothetical protein B0I22_3180 [Epilithonimonas xixisoli]
MVNRNVLKKLSDSELEKYLKEDSRFVPEAVQIAFEILEERGRIFSDEDTLRIKEIILNKKDSQETEKIEKQEIGKDHITEDPNAIMLHSRGVILFFGVFFGFISGALLLSFNCFKIKKYKDGIGIIILGILFSILQHFGIPLMHQIKTNNHITSYRLSPEVFFTILGFLILYFIWIETIKKLPYRPDSLVIPTIIGLLASFLIYINYNGFLPSYFLVGLLK